MIHPVGSVDIHNDLVFVEIFHPEPMFWSVPSADYKLADWGIEISLNQFTKLYRTVTDWITGTINKCSPKGKMSIHSRKQWTEREAINRANKR